MSTKRSFLKIHKPNTSIQLLSYSKIYPRYFSKTIVQSKLSEIRSRIKQNELDATDQFKKENYLQRYNLTPSKVILEKHPILLKNRSLSEIKNTLYLLHKTCGFSDDALLKIYKKYPLIIELHPNDITQCLRRFKSLGFDHYKAFLRLEPSILLQSNPNDSVLLDRLKLFKEILVEIEIENACELLAKHCVHIIQREPKYVLGTLRYYEQLGLDIKQMIKQHPQCMIYTLSHIKKVIRFIHKQVSDMQGIDIKIIQTLPQILGINLDKMKKVIAWLNAVDLFKISEILQQCPHLLICNDVERIDETFKCLNKTYGISRSQIRDNLWILLIRKNSIKRRISVMQQHDLDVSDNIQLIQYDHNHINRWIKAQHPCDQE